MADERRRSLARRSGDDTEAAARSLLERVRTGDLSEDRVFIAAFAGDPASALVFADNEIVQRLTAERTRRRVGVSLPGDIQGVNERFNLNLPLNEGDRLLGWRPMLQYAHDCVQHAVVSRIPETWTALLSVYRFVGAWLRNDARLMKEIAQTAEWWTLSADEDAEPLQMLEGLRLQASEEANHILVEPQDGDRDDLFRVRSIMLLCESLLHRLPRGRSQGWKQVETREITTECLDSLQGNEQAYAAEWEWQRQHLVDLLLKKTSMKNNGKGRSRLKGGPKLAAARARREKEFFKTYFAGSPKERRQEARVWLDFNNGKIDERRAATRLGLDPDHAHDQESLRQWKAWWTERTGGVAPDWRPAELIPEDHYANGKRRNADERRRRLERSASTVEDQARLLGEKIRTGEIPWKRAKAAGALGHPVVLAMQPVTQLADAMEKDEHGIYTFDAWRRFVGFASSFPKELTLTLLDLEETVYPFVWWDSHEAQECPGDDHAPDECPLSSPQPQEIEAFHERHEYFRKLLLGDDSASAYSIVGRARLHDDMMNGSYLVGVLQKGRDILKEPGLTWMADAFHTLTYHWVDEQFPRDARPAWVFERLRNYILNGPGGVKRNRSMKPTKQNPHFAIKQIEKALIQQFSIRALKALVTAFDEEERDPPLWVQVAAVLGTDDPQGRGVRSVAEAKRIAGYMQGDGWDGIDGVIPGEAFDLNVRPVMREIAKVARARGIRGANDASGQLAAVWVDMGRALDKLAVAYNPITGDLVIEAPAELVPADGTIIALGTPVPQRRSASNPPKDESLASASNENTQAFMKAMSGLYDSMAENPGAQVRLADAFKHLKRPGKYGKTHFEADLSATQTARPVPTDAKGRRLWLHPATLMNGNRDFNITGHMGGRLVVTFTMSKEARKNSPDVNVVKAFFRGQDAKSGAVVSKKATIKLGDIDCDACNGAGINEHKRKCPNCDGEKIFRDVTMEVGVLEVRKAPIAWRNDDTRFTLLPKKLVPLTAKKTYEELLETLAPYKVGLTYARSVDGEKFRNEEDVR